MQKNRLCATGIISMALTLMFLTYSVSSLLASNIVISSTGQIVARTVTASSGSASDIQAAIDFLESTQGKGTVMIPEGTWNFVEVGEDWQTVEVPAGINLLGATTEKDADGQVIEWETVLVMPYDVPSGAIWFKLGDGSQDPTENLRFSDIKLVGYRSIDPSSITMHKGIVIYGIVDFRIDHCSFEHVTGAGVTIPSWYQYNFVCSGVIDHCSFVNYHGWDDLANYVNGNIGYGVDIHRSYDAPSGAMPFEPTMEILGQYTDHTIFIEDCYFSKWRHCVASNHGAHYVFRYNVIDQDFGHFSVDAHGLRDSETGRAGTRAIEVYENVFQNITSPDENGGNSIRGVLQSGGGCGVFFNNEIDSSYYAIALYSEDYVSSSTWHLSDFYMWGSLGTWTPTVNYPVGSIDASRNVVADWSRPAYDSTNPLYPNTDPTWSIAGYEPYTYPHPLTLEN